MSLFPKNQPDALSTADDPGTIARGLPTGRAAERLIYAQLLDTLSAQTTAVTVAMERFQGRPLNHVLRVETAVFPTSGFFTVNFGAPCGCVQVRNLSAVAGHTITVSSAPPGDRAPAVGIGVFVVNPSARELVSIGSTILTLYGTAGDSFCYQAYSEGAQPAAV